MESKLKEKQACSRERGTEIFAQSCRSRYFFVGKGAMNIILNIIGGKKVKETNEANVAD